MRNLAKDEIEMAAKREAMLEEGFRLFAEKGIEAVSMQEVANAAKLGVATLYRYYNTKLALVIAIGARRWNDYCAYIRFLQKEKNSEKMTAAEELDF
ncbi:MAG: helix-turn-helix transcriptional regulator, partial [Eubacterium sp.]|nr:helix-turn-helix transcriptional regulator [Eubacterium sp.]